MHSSRKLQLEQVTLIGGGVIDLTPWFPQNGPLDVTLKGCRWLRREEVGAVADDLNQIVAVTVCLYLDVHQDGLPQCGAYLGKYTRNFP